MARSVNARSGAIRVRRLLARAGMPRPQVFPIRRGLLLAVVAGVVASCTSAGSGADLTSSTWTLTELTGAAPLEGTTIELSFPSDGQASGSAGCNRFTGGATVGDGNLRFADLASTMMSCEDLVMEQEAAFFAMLPRVVGFEIVDDELRLTDEDGEVVARFA